MERKLKRTVTVNLTEEQHQHLHLLAEESCRTMSGYLRHLLMERIWEENKNRPDAFIGPYGDPSPLERHFPIWVPI